MKKVINVIAIAALAASATACSYGAIATSGDKVVITRQDHFLLGALRKVFVCNITDAGVTACNSSTNP